MRFSILHISDLHRDLDDEIENRWLLESLERDFAQYDRGEPQIERPSLCIVSGDVVYGVNPRSTDPDAELTRQYAQAEEFLAGLTDRLFKGERNRVIIVPGNHDVSYPEVMQSLQQMPVPGDANAKAQLANELMLPQSMLRFSQSELEYYRIVDRGRYEGRLRHFAEMYDRFYQGRRRFSLSPDSQFAIFDYPALAFSVLALSSCHNNDPLHRAGAIHPSCLAEACRSVRNVEKTGWLAAAVWHHSVSGGPSQNDYVDAEMLQPLIEAGVSLGFHGHQHRPDCVDERYRIGTANRKMTLISASTLCAGPKALSPGAPRSYNVVELDTSEWKGRVHQRQMVNQAFAIPVWGPGHLHITGRSYIDFELCPPLANRDPTLDTQLVLERGEKLVAEAQWQAAVNELARVRHAALARPLLLKALTELGDVSSIMTFLLPPQSPREAVAIGGAILSAGSKGQADLFLSQDMGEVSQDQSVREITRRLRTKWPQ
jgi:hypothetical protein